jgi:TRAP-type C4-dicarboxylate transport system permease small subunit
MQSVFRFFERILFVMLIISGLILIAMMFVTLADILSRTLFNLSDGSMDFTFIGGVEIIRYGLLLMVLFALPYSVGRSQVVVDLFTENLPTRLRAFLDGFFMLGFVVLGAAMAFRFFHAMEQAKLNGETTQDLLLPLFYFYGISSFTCAMLSLSALVVSWRYFFHYQQDS